MIPNEFIVILSALSLGVVGALGTIVGRGAAWVFHVPWSARHALLDAVLAVGIAIATVLTMIAMHADAAYGPAAMAAVATIGVLIRYLVRRARRRNAVADPAA